MTTVRGRRGRDRGVASVEASVLMPVVMGLVLLAVQAGLVFHAGHSVAVAAQAGGQDAASLGGTEETGKAAAEAFLARVAGNELHDTAVEVARTEETVTVTVSGRVMSLFPGWKPRVARTVQVPVERWTW